MKDYRILDRTLSGALSLPHPPVAVAFRPAPPPGVTKFDGRVPSGCSFWRLAGEGRVFYTEPADHYNCPVGSFTHNIPLPPERAAELDQTLGLMMSIGYIKKEELGGIFRLRETPAVVIYAPLAESPVTPDVVVIAGRPGKLMLLQEAAIRAGLSAQPLLGRPTCMALPASMTLGVVMSSGCIGNRVYTSIGEDELYVAIRGDRLERVAAELPGVMLANSALLEYHKDRRETLTQVS